MTSHDSGSSGQCSTRASLSSTDSDFFSLFRAQALLSLRKTPIRTLASSCFAFGSQQLVLSLTRPFKVDLSRCPVVSRIKQGKALLARRPRAEYQCAAADVAQRVAIDVGSSPASTLVILAIVGGLRHAAAGPVRYAECDPTQRSRQES